MVYFSVLIVVFSVLIVVLMHRKMKKEREKVHYIEKKLQSIIANETDEKLLLSTNNDEMKQLLIQINLLLEQNQKIKANYHALERSMRKMLSNISHDLKTPLTVVSGYTEMMLTEENLSVEKKKSLLQTVHLKTAEVLDLIERFFTLVKLESGDRKLDVTKVDITEICRKVILYYYEMLTAKEFEVAIEIPDEPMYIWGNELEMERVLHNLISNAIHHGGAGKMVGLTVKTTKDYAFIEVVDKGKGISEIHINRVFERMYTMDDSRNKNFQGSGLGLTITKRLIEQMGGTIHLHSVPFQKTTFIVEMKRFIF